MEQSTAAAEDAGAASQDPIITADNNRIRVVRICPLPERERQREPY